MMEWYAIETAPKKTYILVYCPLEGSEFIQTAIWFETMWVDSYEGVEIYPPTHWMQLPEPPTP